MRLELRRMAVALLGVPDENHPSAQFAEKYLWSTSPPNNNILQLPPPKPNYQPLYPNVELDDVMIHFRCGDLISTSHPSFGLLKFNTFTKHISPDARTIGIATNPFDSLGQHRGLDNAGHRTDRCRTLITAFVDYLQDRFPTTTIRIRNDPNETIALTYARMIMANQTMSGISTFGVFPSIASFGTGYIYKPNFDDCVNQWVLKPSLLDKLAGNIVMIEGHRIMSAALRKQWKARDRVGRAVIEWFKNDSLSYDVL